MDSSTIRQDLVRLRTLLGEELVAYTFNLTVGELTEVTDRAQRSLDHPRIEALQEFLREISRHAGVPTEVVLDCWIDTSGRHVCNIIREHCGAARPDVTFDDPLVEAFAKYAVEVYPSLLVSPRHFSGWLSGPLGQLTLRAALADSSIRTLFERANPVSATTSLGIAGPFYLEGVLQGVVDNAFAYSRLRGCPTVDGMLQHLVDLIDLLRRVCCGEKGLKVPAFVGINNVALPSGVHIDGGDIQLRPFEPSMRCVVPEFAESPQVDQQGMLMSCIVETAVPYVVVFDASAQTFKKMNNSASKLLTEIAPDVLLALTLAIPREPQPVGAFRSWSTVLNPFGYGAHVSGAVARPGAFRVMRHHVVTAQEGEDIIPWLALVQTRKHRSIELGIRRILSAVGTRSNPIDGFIDAVVTWENLFGERQGELTFRISAAMSRLLARDIVKREAIQQEIKGLYNKRSDIVHGTREYTTPEAKELRDTATHYAIQALRVLFRDQPHLLSERGRATKIILGDAPPPSRSSYRNAAHPPGLDTWSWPRPTKRVTVRSEQRRNTAAAEILTLQQPLQVHPSNHHRSRWRVNAQRETYPVDAAGGLCWSVDFNAALRNRHSDERWCRSRVYDRRPMESLESTR